MGGVRGRMGVVEPIRLRRAVAAKPRAVCAIIRAETLPEADIVFERRVRAFAQEVLAFEPGCSSYVVTRQLGSSTHFAAHVRFESWRAFNLHARSAHLERAMPELTALMARPISIEIFFEV